uniref:LTD domain-containing protein n=1 Tax=uncultured bacterium contig00048 TaxID=1181533 RepID=A0A806KHJ2_9BACT|nr:hypothetical protein [uncultured bacterium contig00048]
MFKKLSILLSMLFALAFFAVSCSSDSSSGGENYDGDSSSSNPNGDAGSSSSEGGSSSSQQTAGLKIGFVYFGTDAQSAGTNAFVEIYNPENFEVTLDGKYSLQYKSIQTGATIGQYVTQETTPDWLKLDLVGTIPAKTSFLVNMGASGSENDGGLTTNGRLDLSGKVFDQEFTEAASKLHNKGVKVVLLSNQNLLSNDVKNPFYHNGARVPGYLDMIGLSGNDATGYPDIDGCEGSVNNDAALLDENGEMIKVICMKKDTQNGQSKQKGFARISQTGTKYADTDNNLVDFVMVDFRVSDMENACLLPRGKADGAWSQPSPCVLPTPPSSSSSSTNATGGSSSSSLEACTPPSDYSDLVLNEISGNNKYVEIYNSGATDICLTGVKLDRNNGGSSWTGRAGDAIPAGEYRIFLFNSFTPAGLETNPAYVGWTVGSGISSGQTLRIALIAPDNSIIDLFIRGDGTGTGSSTGVTQDTDNTYSRMPDDTWAYAVATPGAENEAGTGNIENPGYLTADP